MAYKDKEKRIKYQRDYRKNNPSKIRETNLKRYYGITMEEYNNMLFSQKGLCKICRKSTATHVDHCHKTGKVRGILCNECNAGLGFLKDNISYLLNAIEYLK